MNCGTPYQKGRTGSSNETCGEKKESGKGSCGADEAQISKNYTIYTNIPNTHTHICVFIYIYILDTLHTNLIYTNILHDAHFKSTHIHYTLYILCSYFVQYAYTILYINILHTI